MDVELVYGAEGTDVLGCVQYVVIRPPDIKAVGCISAPGGRAFVCPPPLFVLTTDSNVQSSCKKKLKKVQTFCTTAVDDCLNCSHGTDFTSTYSLYPETLLRFH